MLKIKDQLARALADYDNLRKRTDEEKVAWSKFSSQNIVLRLLPILDILEKAQSHLKDEGLVIAISEFKKILIEEELEEINPKVGSEFDANSQEVIEVVDGKEDNMIQEVVLSGWKFKDGQVIRHARVKVTKK